MALPVSALPDLSRRIAFLVMRSNGEAALCPFFGKCDGLLVIDPDSASREFHPSTQDTPEAMCDLILKTGAHRLVLGFIGGPAAQKLRAGGIDIRLGSCATTVDELAVGFDSLPAA